MKKFTLTRTGDRPVQFAGELLAEADSRQTQGPCQNRWYELALYRAESGKYVVAIDYRTQWQGELDEVRVYLEDSAANVAKTLRTQISELPLHGFPPGAQYDERRAHVAGAIRKCYERAVSELLAEIEPEEI